MNDKLKFYRSTLVQMTKEAYRKMPNELKIEESVVEADELTKAIMKKVDEFEVAMEQHFNLDGERVNYYTNNTMWTGPAFIGTTTKVNPDFLKTEPMRTIVDNDPQYQPNQKPYGTLGEHKEELQRLYQIKEQCGFKFIKDFANGKIPYSTTLSSIKEILGIDFIKDFIKACEKCEE